MKLTLLIFLLTPLSLYAIAFNCRRGHENLTYVLTAKTEVANDLIQKTELEYRQQNRHQQQLEIVEIRTQQGALLDVEKLVEEKWGTNVKPPPGKLYGFLKKTFEFGDLVKIYAAGEKKFSYEKLKKLGPLIEAYREFAVHTHFVDNELGVRANLNKSIEGPLPKEVVLESLAGASKRMGVTIDPMPAELTPKLKEKLKALEDELAENGEPPFGFTFLLNYHARARSHARANVGFPPERFHDARLFIELMEKIEDFRATP